MVRFGVAMIPTEHTIQPADFARWAEANGIESLWFGEHSHIPVKRTEQRSPSGMPPDYYARFLSQFLALTAAAAATTTLKIGTAVTLIPEHDPINLAKMVSTIDRMSGGRFIFGIGSGWNVDELANHGVAFKDRWKVTRERILAMRTIWTNDEAEYHGQFVNFDPIWCWPKPVQTGGPPVLMGAVSKWSPARMAEYCDGWLAFDLGADLADMLASVRSAMDKAGRTMDKFDLSIMMEPHRLGAEAVAKRIPELIKIGFQRFVLLTKPAPHDEQWEILDQCAGIARRFQ